MTGWFAIVALSSALALTGGGGDDADSASDPLDPVPAAAEGGEWMKAEAGGAVSFRLVDDDGLQQIVVTPEYDPGAQADGPVTSVALVFG